MHCWDSCRQRCTLLHEQVASQLFPDSAPDMYALVAHSLNSFDYSQVVFPWIATISYTQLIPARKSQLMLHS